MLQIHEYELKPWGPLNSTTSDKIMEWFYEIKKLNAVHKVSTFCIQKHFIIIKTIYSDDLKTLS